MLHLLTRLCLKMNCTRKLYRLNLMFTLWFSGEFFGSPRHWSKVHEGIKEGTAFGKACYYSLWKPISSCEIWVCRGNEYEEWCSLECCTLSSDTYWPTFRRSLLIFRIVFWDVLPCKIIVDRRFRGTCCLHHHWWLQFWTSYSPPWELEISQAYWYWR
jgi:hypothetical protein